MLHARSCPHPVKTLLLVISIGLAPAFGQAPEAPAKASTRPEYSMMDNFRYTMLAVKAMKQNHRDIIESLQKQLNKKDPLKTFQLFFLALSYYEIRDYKNLLTIAELMDRQIAQGDKWVPEGFGQGTNLACAPAMFRGAAGLDLGAPAQAVKDLDQAYAVMLATLGEQPLTKVTAPIDANLHLSIPGYLGVAHAALGHDPEADKFLTILTNVNLGDHFMVPYKTANLAKVYLATRQYGKALEILQGDEKMGGKWMENLFVTGTFQDVPKAYILARCLFETGDLPHARQGYDQLLASPKIKEVGGIYWPILLDRARIANRDKDAAKAIQCLKEAVEVIEQQRATIHSETGRIGFAGDKQAVYQELVARLVENGRPEDAFDYVERAKGRALVDLLASQHRLAPAATKAGQMLGLVANLAAADQDAGALMDPDPAKQANGARGIAVKLRSDLAAGAPELASLVMVNPTPVAELQAKVGEDETILEYFKCGEAWYAFLVTRAGVKAVPLPGGDLGRSIEGLRNAVTHPGSKDFQAASEALSRQVLAPVAGLIGTTRLTIVPHGVLHYVPFAALTLGGTSSIDRFSLRILPSASVLRFLKGARQVQRTLVLGNPDLGNQEYNLPFAQDEAVAIAKLLPQATLLVRAEATAKAVRELGPQADIIHLAAHGYFDPNLPLESGLLLAKGDGSDGTLRVSEFYSLPLDADLVTLSACDTGLSLVANGDDVVGFTRGLLYAGSRSVLSSLWKVDDQSTKELMISFYQGLARYPKAEALRQAQLAVRKRHPDPYYWAGFILTGNAM